MVIYNIYYCVYNVRNSSVEYLKIYVMYFCNNFNLSFMY